MNNGWQWVIWFKTWILVLELILKYVYSYIMVGNKEKVIENVNCMQGELYRLMPSIIYISLNET